MGITKTRMNCMTQIATRFFLLAATIGLCNPVSAQDTFRVAPYLQFGTKTSMVVMWETEVEATTRVEYGESRLGDEEPNLSQHVSLPGRQSMHEVILTGLKPETKYFWRAVSTLADGTELASAPSTFRTAVNDSSAYAFILYGDTQSNPEVWGKLATLGWLERPNFGLLAGDLVDRGGQIDDWLVEFFPPANIFMKRYALYTVIGNHEDDDPNYYKYMHNPAPEYYYTFRYGNAQFFMIDTNRDVREGSEQYEWLEWQLAQSEATWKFVVHHHPPYSSEENDHGDTSTGSSSYGTGARNLVPLFEKFNVDFSLFGHVHMYERTWPLLENAVDQENGVIYINSGGGGGGLEQFAPTRSWFSAKVKSVHHMVSFSIHDRTLFYQAIDEDGNVFDSFQLHKDAAKDMARTAIPPAPRMEPFGGMFLDDMTVTLTGAFGDEALYYTTDGSTPSATSTRYTRPIRVEDDMTLRVVAISKAGAASRVRSADFRKGVMKQPARASAAQQKGLTFKYYEGAWDMLPDFDRLTPVRSGTIESVDLKAIETATDGYAVLFEGYIEVPADGVYNFFTRSDDGSKLFIGSDLVVSNDGSHNATREEGMVALKKGLHQFRLEYFEDHGDEALTVGWEGPGMVEQHLRSGVFFRAR